MNDLARRFFRLLVPNIPFALVCLVISRLGTSFSLDNSGVSLVWPLSGVSIAVLILRGRHLWLGIWLGVLLSNIMTGTPLPIGIGVAVGSTAMAVFGAELLHGRGDFRPTFARVRDVLRFVLIGAFAAPILSAVVGASCLYLAGMVTQEGYLTTLLTWWVGDAMGVLVVAPMLLIWGTSRFSIPDRRRLAEAVVLLVALVVVSWVVFNQGFAPTSFYPLAFLIFPFLVWGALRFDQRTVVSLTVLITLIAVVQTTRQLDTFNRSTIWNSLLFLWAYIATTAVTAMLLAATLAERRQVERVVRGLEERFSKAFHSAPVAIWITRIEDGAFIDVNEEFCRLMGYERAEAIGKTSVELNIWERPETRQELIAAVRASGQISQLQTRMRSRQGDLHEGLISLEQIELEGLPRLLAMFHDITERLHVEEALRQSEAHYRQLFEGIDDAIFVHDLEANILDVNDGATRRLGYSRAELLSMKITDIDAPGFAANYHERLAQQLQQGSLSQIEGAQITKDGREIVIDVTSKLITYRGLPAVLAVVRDITERKRAEQQLRESEARYRAIIEDQTEMICRLTPDWRLTFVNDAYCLYWGRTREELLGSYFKPTIYEEDYPRLAEKVRSLSADSPVVASEHRVVLEDGALRWHQLTNRAIIGEGGQIVEYQFVGKDITEVKEMEKQRLAIAIEHEKVNILADFIAAASHDFRTPLSVINTSAYLLNRINDPAQRSRHFKQIQDQTYHIEQLVDGLLTMSRLDRGDVFRFKPISLNLILQQIEARKRSQLDQRGLALTLDLDPTLPQIEADETWLFRGIVQLIDNAIHYTPNGGEITLRTTLDNDQVIIAVSDTGIGITQEDLPNIFKRLYRGEGHRPVGGQGLGLSIAAKIIEAHQGNIEVESRVGFGSTFRVLLPIKRSDTTVEPLPSP
ncbi:MAG: PAS domain S-box protein [Anaerolineae bacterium]